MEKGTKNQLRLWADYEKKRIGLHVRVSDWDISAVSPQCVKLKIHEAGIDHMVVEEIQVEVIDDFPLSNVIGLMDVYKETLKTIQIIAISPYSHASNTQTPIEPNSQAHQILPTELNSFQIKTPFILKLNWQRRKYSTNANIDLLKTLKFFKSLGVIQELHIQPSNTRLMQRETLQQILEEIVDLNSLTALSFNINNYFPSSLFACLSKPLILPQLKSVNFDFENVSLKDEGVNYIWQFLKTTARSVSQIALNLHYNELTDESIVRILDAIENVEDLQVLQLAISANPFKEIGTKRIVNFIKTNSFKWKDLDLNLMLLNLLNRSHSVALLSSLSHMHNVQHLKLNLSSAQFARPNEDMQLLAIAFFSMNSLKSLSLNLSRSNIGSNTGPLFTSLLTIKGLEHLSLNLLTTSFEERRFEALENCILAQEKTLHRLTLELVFPSKIRQNQQMYLRLLKLIEFNFPVLLQVDIKDLELLNGDQYSDVLGQLKRVEAKLFYRQKLIYSLRAFKRMVICRTLKRTEMATELIEFLNESEYAKKIIPV